MSSIDIYEDDMAEETEPEAPPTSYGWRDKIAREEARKDRLKGPALIGEFVAVLAVSALLWFFVAHKLQDTGFFTDEFGAVEMFFMYAAGAFALVPVILRLILRRRNILRPLDAVNLLFLSAAHAVLLASFPFDFEHVTAVLPGFLTWTVGWISDSVGTAILWLGLIGGLLGATFTMVVYIGVRRQLSLAPPPEAPEPKD